MNEQEYSYIDSMNEQAHDEVVYERGLKDGERRGAISELEKILNHNQRKQFKALTTNDEEVVLIYVKAIEKRLKELKGELK